MSRLSAVAAGGGSPFAAASRSWRMRSLAVSRTACSRTSMPGIPAAAGVPAMPALASASSASRASRACSAAATVIALPIASLPSVRIASGPMSTVSWATKKVTMARKKNSRTGLT